MHHIRKLSDLNPKLSEKENKYHYVDLATWSIIVKQPNPETETRKRTSPRVITITCRKP
jgi:hypothetical protein